MESELNSRIRERTEGALAGIEGLDLASLDPGSLVIVLTAVGDAMRLGIPLPSRLSHALRDVVSEAQVLAALDALTESVGQWSLPMTPSPEESDPGLEWALRRRDEVESVLLAARRTLLPRGRLVDESEQAARLGAAIEAHDLSCGGQVSRTEAELYLGERLELVDDPSWLDEVVWREAEVDPAAGIDDLPDLSEHTRPSLEHMEAYVVEGRLKRWIEAASARWPEVAEDTEDMIATYREHRSTVSLVARQWQAARRRTPGSEGAVVVTLDPPGPADRAAAADETSELVEPVLEEDLGVLDPGDARASLRIAPSALELTVFAGQTPLSEVQLGDRHAEPPQRGGTWTVRVERDPNAAATSVSLRVVDTQGRAFEARIAIGPGR
jgi:hypothetical protein